MRVQKRRHPGRTAAAVTALALALIGCTLGDEQEPGCRHDDECDEGFSCRAGACFRTTTDRLPPATDAGDGGAEDAD